MSHAPQLTREISPDFLWDDVPTRQDNKQAGSVINGAVERREDGQQLAGYLSANGNDSPPKSMFAPAVHHSYDEIRGS
jgi:hypothetical protein